MPHRASAATLPLPIDDLQLPNIPPPLKWAGGKRWLLPKLRSMLANVQYARLVEPFVGGLAVALGLRPERALLHDANPHLINFYRWVQRGLDLRSTGVVFENARATYFKNRSAFNDLVATGKSQTSEAAALFYYLNRTAFNGLCRFNKQGLFNVPFGRYRKISYRDAFTEYAAVLKGYTFDAGDFEEIQLTTGDLVYADPPYDVEFTSYSAGGFSWGDQQRLAHFLASHDGPIVASNQATPRILDLYCRLDFKVEQLPGPRRISCNGNRDNAVEMLAHRGF